MDQTYSSPLDAVVVRLHHTISSPPNSLHWLPFPSLINQLRRHLCQDSYLDITTLAPNHLNLTSSDGSIVHKLQQYDISSTHRSEEPLSFKSLYSPLSNPFHINAKLDSEHALLDQINYIEPATGNTYLMSACASLGIGQSPSTTLPQASIIQTLTPNPEQSTHVDNMLLERVALVHWLLDLGADPNLINTYTKKTLLHILFETTPNLSPPIMSIITRLIFEYSVSITSVDGSNKLPIGSLLGNPFLQLTPTFFILVNALVEYNRSDYPPQSHPLVQPLAHILLANKKHFEIKWPSAQDFTDSTISKVPFTLPEISSSHPNILDFNQIYTRCIDIELEFEHDEYEWRLYKHLLFSFFPAQRHHITTPCHIESVRSPAIYSIISNPLPPDSCPKPYHIPPLPFYQLFTILPKLAIGLSYDEVYTNLSPTERQDQLHAALMDHVAKEPLSIQSKTILPAIPHDNVITNPSLPPIAMLQCFYLANPDWFQNIHQPIILMLLSHPYITPRHVEIIKFLLLLRQDVDLHPAPLLEIMTQLLTKTYTIPPHALLKQLPQIFSPLALHTEIEACKNKPSAAKFPWESGHFSPQIKSQIGAPTDVHNASDNTHPRICYPLDHYGTIPPFESDWDENLFTTRTAPYLDLLSFTFALIENWHYSYQCILRNKHYTTQIARFHREGEESYLELIKNKNYSHRRPIQYSLSDPSYRSPTQEDEAAQTLQEETVKAIDMNRTEGPLLLPKDPDITTGLNSPENIHYSLFSTHSFQHLCALLIKQTSTSTMLHINQLEEVHKFILYYSPLTNPYCNMQHLLASFLEQARRSSKNLKDLNPLNNSDHLEKSQPYNEASDVMHLVDLGCKPSQILLPIPYPHKQTVQNNSGLIEKTKIELKKKIVEMIGSECRTYRPKRQLLLTLMSQQNISIKQIEDIPGKSLWTVLKGSAIFEYQPDQFWEDLCLENETEWQSKVMNEDVRRRLHGVALNSNGFDHSSDSLDENSSSGSDSSSDDDASDGDSDTSGSDSSDSDSSASDSSASDSSDSDEDYFEPLSPELVKDFADSRAIILLSEAISQAVAKVSNLLAAWDVVDKSKSRGIYHPDIVRVEHSLIFQHQTYHFPQQYHHKYYQQLLLSPQSLVRGRNELSDLTNVQNAADSTPPPHNHPNQIDWSFVFPKNATLLTAIFKPLDGSFSSQFFQNGELKSYVESLEQNQISAASSEPNSISTCQTTTSSQYSQLSGRTMNIPSKPRSIYPSSRPRHVLPVYNYAEITNSRNSISPLGSLLPRPTIPLFVQNGDSDGYKSACAQTFSARSRRVALKSQFQDLTPTNLVPRVKKYIQRLWNIQGSSSITENGKEIASQRSTDNISTTNNTTDEWSGFIAETNKMAPIVIKKTKSESCNNNMDSENYIYDSPQELSNLLSQFSLPYDLYELRYMINRLYIQEYRNNIDKADTFLDFDKSDFDNQIDEALISIIFTTRFDNFLLFSPFGDQRSHLNIPQIIINTEHHGSFKYLTRFTNMYAKYWSDKLHLHPFLAEFSPTLNYFPFLLPTTNFWEHLCSHFSNYWFSKPLWTTLHLVARNTNWLLGKWDRFMSGAEISLVKSDWARHGHDYGDSKRTTPPSLKLKPYNQSVSRQFGVQDSNSSSNDKWTKNSDIFTTLLSSTNSFHLLSDRECDELWWYLTEYLGLTPIMNTNELRRQFLEFPHLMAYRYSQEQSLARSRFTLVTESTPNVQQPQHLSTSSKSITAPTQVTSSKPTTSSKSTTPSLIAPPSKPPAILIHDHNTIPELSYQSLTSTSSAKLQPMPKFTQCIDRYNLTRDLLVNGEGVGEWVVTCDKKIANYDYIKFKHYQQLMKFQDEDGHPANALQSRIESLQRVRVQNPSGSYIIYSQTKQINKPYWNGKISEAPLKDQSPVMKQWFRSDLALFDDSCTAFHTTAHWNLTTRQELDQFIANHNGFGYLTRSDGSIDIEQYMPGFTRFGMDGETEVETVKSISPSNVLSVVPLQLSLTSANDLLNSHIVDDYVRHSIDTQANFFYNFIHILSNIRQFDNKFSHRYIQYLIQNYFQIPPNILSNFFDIPCSTPVQVPAFSQTHTKSAIIPYQASRSGLNGGRKPPDSFPRSYKKTILAFHQGNDYLFRKSPNQFPKLDTLPPASPLYTYNHNQGCYELQGGDGIVDGLMVDHTSPSLAQSSSHSPFLFKTSHSSIPLMVYKFVQYDLGMGHVIVDADGIEKYLKSINYSPQIDLLPVKSQHHCPSPEYYRDNGSEYPYLDSMSRFREVYALAGGCGGDQWKLQSSVSSIKDSDPSQSINTNNIAQNYQNHQLSSPPPPRTFFETFSDDDEVLFKTITPFSSQFSIPTTHSYNTISSAESILMTSQHLATTPSSRFIGHLQKIWVDYIALVSSNMTGLNTSIAALLIKVFQGSQVGDPMSQWETGLVNLPHQPIVSIPMARSFGEVCNCLGNHHSNASLSPSPPQTHYRPNLYTKCTYCLEANVYYGNAANVITKPRNPFHRSMLFNALLPTIVPIFFRQSSNLIPIQCIGSYWRYAEWNMPEKSIKKQLPSPERCLSEFFFEYALPHYDLKSPSSKYDDSRLKMMHSEYSNVSPNPTNAGHVTLEEDGALDFNPATLSNYPPQRLSNINPNPYTPYQFLNPFQLSIAYALQYFHIEDRSESNACRAKLDNFTHLISSGVISQGKPLALISLHTANSIAEILEMLVTRPAEHLVQPNNGNYLQILSPVPDPLAPDQIESSNTIYHYRHGTHSRPVGNSQKHDMERLIGVVLSAIDHITPLRREEVFNKLMRRLAISRSNTGTRPPPISPLFTLASEAGFTRELVANMYRQNEDDGSAIPPTYKSLSLPTLATLYLPSYSHLLSPRQDLSVLAQSLKNNFSIFVPLLKTAKPLSNELQESGYRDIDYLAAQYGIHGLANAREWSKLDFYDQSRHDFIWYQTYGTILRAQLVGMLDSYAVYIRKTTPTPYIAWTHDNSSATGFILHTSIRKDFFLGGGVLRQQQPQQPQHQLQSGTMTRDDNSSTVNKSQTPSDSLGSLSGLLTKLYFDGYSMQYVNTQAITSSTFLPNKFISLFRNILDIIRYQFNYTFSIPPPPRSLALKDNRNTTANQLPPWFKRFSPLVSVLSLLPTYSRLPQWNSADHSSAHIHSNQSPSFFDKNNYYGLQSLSGLQSHGFDPSPLIVQKTQGFNLCPAFLELCQDVLIDYFLSHGTTFGKASPIPALNMAIDLHTSPISSTMIQVSPNMPLGYLERLVEKVHLGDGPIWNKTIGPRTPLPILEDVSDSIGLNPSPSSDYIDPNAPKEEESPQRKNIQNLYYLVDRFIVSDTELSPADIISSIPNLYPLCSDGDNFDHGNVETNLIPSLDPDTLFKSHDHIISDDETYLALIYPNQANNNSHHDNCLQIEKQSCILESAAKNTIDSQREACSLLQNANRVQSRPVPEDIQSELTLKENASTTTLLLAHLHHNHPFPPDPYTIPTGPPLDLHSRDYVHFCKPNFQLHHEKEIRFDPTFYDLSPNEFFRRVSLSAVCIVLTSAILRQPMVSPDQIEFLKWVGDVSHQNSLSLGPATDDITGETSSAPLPNPCGLYSSFIPELNVGNAYLGTRASIINDPDLPNNVFMNSTTLAISPAFISTQPNYHHLRLLEILIRHFKLPLVPPLTQIEVGYDYSDQRRFQRPRLGVQHEDLLAITTLLCYPTNKNWQMLLNMLLSSGSRFTAPFYVRAFENQIARKALAAAMTSFNSAILPELKPHCSNQLLIRPDAKKNSMEHKLWERIEQYQIFNLPPNNIFSTPVDALCQHPIIEVGMFWTKIKQRAIAQKIKLMLTEGGKDQNGQASGRDRSSSNQQVQQSSILLPPPSSRQSRAVLVDSDVTVTLSELLETVTDVVQEYSTAKDEISDIISRYQNQFSLQLKIQQADDPQPGIPHILFLDFIRSSLDQDPNFGLHLNVVNRWRYCLDIVLPSLDLYPNFSTGNTPMCSCELGSICEVMDERMGPLAEQVTSGCLYHTYTQALNLAAIIGLSHIHDIKSNFLQEDPPVVSLLSLPSSDLGLKSVTAPIHPYYKPIITSRYINHYTLTPSQHFFPRGTPSLYPNQNLYRQGTAYSQPYIHYSPTTAISSFTIAQYCENISYEHLHFITDLLHPTKITSLDHMGFEGVGEYISPIGIFPDSDIQPRDIGQIRTRLYEDHLKLLWDRGGCPVDGAYDENQKSEEDQEKSKNSPLALNTKSKSSYLIQKYGQLYPHRDAFVQIQVHSLPPMKPLHDPNAQFTPEELQHHVEQAQLFPAISPRSFSFKSRPPMLPSPSSQEYTHDYLDLLPNNFATHHPFQLNFHLASPQTRPYHRHLIPTFTSGMLWHLITTTPITSDDIITILTTSTNVLTHYNTCTSTNHFRQGILSIALLRCIDDRGLMALWNTTQGRGDTTVYTMEYSDVVYTILFSKDNFGWILKDYIKFTNSEAFAPHWTAKVLEAYDMYQ